MREFLLVILLCSPTPLANAQVPSAPAAISDADEIRAGAVLAAKFEEANGLAPTPQTTKIDAYLQKVGDRVASHAQRGLPYQFHFDPDPAFKSAVALPGGQVFVGAGILTYMDTEDQLAAVLGHEIEHVALGQCRDRLIQEMAKKHLSKVDFEKARSRPVYARLRTRWRVCGRSRRSETGHESGLFRQRGGAIVADVCADGAADAQHALGKPVESRSSNRADKVFGGVAETVAYRKTTWPARVGSSVPRTSTT